MRVIRCGIVALIVGLLGPVLAIGPAGAAVLWSWTPSPFACSANDNSCLSGTGFSPLVSYWGQYTNSRGNCTDYVAYRLQHNGATKVNAPGNATTWKDQVVKQFGAAAVNGTPKVGSIAWWQSGDGHVGYVESVSADGNSISTSESIWAIGSRRRILTRGVTGWPDAFLHIKDAPGAADGPSGYEIAFQANTGSLWNTGTAGTGNLLLGMKAGTSPSIARLSNGGYQIAFQSNTGSLWTAGAAGTANLQLGMMAGTSPAITAQGSGYQIAFQANTGSLWTAGAAGTANLLLGMKAGTSPSIARLSNGGYQIAFQSNTGSLWTAGAAGTANLQLGMMAGTSPAITAQGSGYQIAFQANTGSLWTAGAPGTANLLLGMKAGTSPSIARLSNGGYQIAFQSNTGSLWTTGAAGTANLQLGMMAGTSPAITAQGSGYQIAFQANTGSLWTAGAAGTANLLLGMKAGTSPSIAS